MILLQGHPCLTRNQSLWLSIWFNIRFSSCLWFCIDYVSPCRSFCRYPHHIHRYVSEHIGVMSGHFFHFLAKERVVEWLPLASEYLQNHPAYIADPGSDGQTAMGKSWRTLDVERGFPPSSLSCFFDVENGSITVVFRCRRWKRMMRMAMWWIGTTKCSTLGFKSNILETTGARRSSQSRSWSTKRARNVQIPK